MICEQKRDVTQFLFMETVFSGQILFREEETIIKSVLAWLKIGDVMIKFSAFSWYVQNERSLLTIRLFCSFMFCSIFEKVGVFDTVLYCSSLACFDPSKLFYSKNRYV